MFIMISETSDDAAVSLPPGCPGPGQPLAAAEAIIGSTGIIK